MGLDYFMAKWLILRIYDNNNPLTGDKFNRCQGLQRLTGV